MLVDDDAHRVIAQFLGPGERLLWTGRPRRGVVFHRTNFGNLFQGLVGLGIGSYFEWLAVRHGANVFSVVVGPVWILCGLRFALAPFVLDPWRRAQTFYGVSDDRAIIVSHWFGTKVDSVPLKTLDDLRFTEKPDGTGTIRLGKLQWQVIWDPISRYLIRWVWGPKREFEDIPDVRSVYNVIVKVQPDLALLAES